MRSITYIFWFLVVLLGVVFVVLNSHSVPINYYIGKTEIYYPLLLLIELAVGALFGIITMLPIIIKQKANILRLKNKVKEVELELNSLRTMPVRDIDSC